MRKVISQLRQYKKDTFLCIGLTALEVVMEILPAGMRTKSWTPKGRSS